MFKMTISWIVLAHCEWHVSKMLEWWQQKAGKVNDTKKKQLEEYFAAD